MTPLTIAIDFDDTFTADVETWTKVIKLLHGAGHKVICVSARNESLGNRYELDDALPDEVFALLLSALYPKKQFAEERGYFVDIWIDDWPQAVCGDRPG